MQPPCGCRHGLESDEKKAPLVRKWGDVRFPNLASYCSLFLRVCKLSPGEPLHCIRGTRKLATTESQRLYIAIFSLGFGKYPIIASSASDSSELIEDEPHLNHVLHGESCFFKWTHDDKFDPDTCPSAYSGGQPEIFIALLDSSKKGGPRTVYTASVGEKFNFVVNIPLFPFEMATYCRQLYPVRYPEPTSHR